MKLRLKTREEEKAKKKKKKREEDTKENEREKERWSSHAYEKDREKGEIGEASLSRCIAIQACVRARDSAPEGILLISRGPLRKVICTIRK